jgi:serine/threonine protein kinase
VWARRSTKCYCSYISEGMSSTQSSMPLQHCSVSESLFPARSASTHPSHGVSPHQPHLLALSSSVFSQRRSATRSFITWLCMGLYYLHNQTPPIIHQDLASNNVLLTPDLGVARILNLTPLQVSRTYNTESCRAFLPACHSCLHAIRADGS